MKKISAFLLIITLIITSSGCNLEDIIKNAVKQSGISESGESDLQAPEGSPDWCGFSNADQIMKKYLNGDASATYKISELLGTTSYKNNSYGGAKVDLWVYYNNEGSRGEYYATIYFNEDGSDVWVRVDPYVSVGTEYHYVDGKLAEEIPIEEAPAENGE